MKNLLLLTLLLSSSAQATSLVCFTQTSLKTPSGPITAVVFSHADNLKNPEETAAGEASMRASLPDQDTYTAFQLKGDQREAGFSNGCDSEYTASFNAAKFDALLKGEINQITGMLSYTDSDERKFKTKLICRTSLD